jgi:DNA-binding CsgD family transcriptional regulator/PAS domain-containing protein
MATQNLLLPAIEAVYAAGLDETLWPDALAQVMHAVGGIAATLEVFERSTARLTEFHYHDLPPGNEVAYLDHYFSLNPRIPALINGKPGNIVTDYAVLDERSMNRDAFYSAFLAPTGYRYFIGAMFDASAREAFLFSVQRSAKQGHVGKDETTKMRLLLPHVRQAFDMTRRLRGTNAVDRSFKAALDWLSDGICLLRADGPVLHANEIFQAIARRGDGIRIHRGAVDIADPDGRAQLAAAIGAAGKARGSFEPGSGDMTVPRRAGAPPYIVSVRPLVRAARERHRSNADIIIFVHDPLQRNAASARMLRDLFGLTEAEADLARALQAGATPGNYARTRAVSLNTVYTHLRRIKEKTGCHRMPELIRKLNDLHIPLRLD